MSALWLWTIAAVAAPLTADEAVDRALQLARPIVEGRAEVERARGDARAAAFLQQDPMVRGRWGVLGDVRGVSLSQPVSITGEGLAARRSALASVDRAEAALERIRLEVAAAARLAWVLAVEADQRVALAEDALTLAARLREGAEARLASGDSSLLDAQLARLQEAEARSTWMAAVEERGLRLAELSVWTGESVDALELPADPLEGMEAIEAGETRRADLEAAQHGVAAAQAALSRERAGVLPPLQLGAFIEEEGAELRAGPTVAVTVPLWRRNADGRAGARAELSVASSVVAERERMVRAEQQTIALVLQTLEAASDEVDLHNEASAALQSVAVGYARGEFDLLTAGLLRQQIIEGQRAWLQGRRIRATTRIAAALAAGDRSLIP